MLQTHKIVIEMQPDLYELVTRLENGRGFLVRTNDTQTNTHLRHIFRGLEELVAGA